VQCPLSLLGKLKAIPSPGSHDAMTQEQDARNPMPRKLTTHQKAVLIQVLRTFPDERVEIRYATEASDALAYAQDFLSIFKAIGWNVAAPDAKPLAAKDRLSPLAALIADRNLPACAEALRDALRIYEIELTTHPHATDASAAHTFTLWVGPT
jgi:hypothetical protein